MKKRTRNSVVYQRILDLSLDLICVVGMDGYFKYLNPVWEATLGYSVPELLSRPFLDIVHPDDHARSKEEVEKLAAGHKSLDFEIRCIHQDGSIRHISWTAQSVRDEKEIYGIGRDITERKRAERELLKERDTAQRYLDLAGVIFVAIDGNGEVILVNQKGCEVLGYSEEEILGKNWFEDFTPERLREDLTSVSKRLLRGDMESVEYHENPVLTKTGEEKIIAWRNTILRDDEGNITGTLSSGEDITERRQAENALRESEERYRTIFVGVAEIIYVISRDLKIVSLNPAFEKISGWSIEEWIGREATPLVHPEDLTLLNSRLQRRISGEKVEPGVYRFLTKSGEYRTFEFLPAPLTKDGKVIGLFGIARDITERKRAEDELRWRTELNQILLDALPCVALLLRPGTHEVVAANRAGREAGAIPGATCYETLGHRTPCPWCLAPKVWQTSEPQHREVEAGGVFWDSHWVPINKDLYLHYYFDVTEQKRMQARLKQAQKMEAIGTLAGGIAHDFNNILSPIIIHSELAMMELPPDSPVQQNLQYILRAGERARDLVKQILTFARRREEDRIPLRASLMVKEAMKLLRSTIPSTIDVQYEFKTEQDTVLADPSQVNQIVMNLCTNAAHAMLGKGGLLKVTLSDAYIRSDEKTRFVGLDPGPYLRLSVSDTGSGIPPGIIDKIFDPYFTTKGPGEGTGLGLAVVLGIVKNYGGDIAVDSEPGKGSTFHVMLPIIEEEPFPTVVQQPVLPRGTERILLVDDEKAAVDTIQSMLERLGYKVTARTSSIEALEAFRHKTEAFDLVITDQTMPNMTGKELARELMALQPDIQIILCTGFSEQIDERIAEEMGISAFVMKPIVMKEMANTIREVLGKGSPQRDKEDGE